MSGTEEARRTPLGRARGLGSAKEGTAHWWAQRLTAIALVPLTIWFVASIVLLTGSGYDRAVAWIGEPLPAILLVLLIFVAFHHAQLGIQVVVEDYVHNGAVKLACIVLAKFAAIILGLGAIFAVLKIAFGG